MGHGHSPARGQGGGGGGGPWLGSGPASPAQLAQTVELLSNRAVLLMPGFQARAVSNVWWACATMREPPAPQLLHALLQRSLATIDDFAPQTIANTLWSLATLRIKPAPELLEALAVRALAIAEDFQPQVLASSLWALATMVPLGIALPRDMIHALLSCAQRLAPYFAQQAYILKSTLCSAFT